MRGLPEVLILNSSETNLSSPRYNSLEDFKKAVENAKKACVINYQAGAYVPTD